MRTLVLGGARSGKSSWAEQQLVSTHPDDTLSYIATARPWPGDEDFETRIMAHRRRRQAAFAGTLGSWNTEDKTDAVEALQHPDRLGAAVLLDDVGTWLTHVLDTHNAWNGPRGATERDLTALVAAVRCWPDEKDLFIVSPEVGLSVIPEHRSGRLFRDELGTLNQQLASECERVVLVVAGCPLVLKSALTS